MAIINSSANLYGASSSTDASFAMVLRLAGDFAAEVFNPNANDSFNAAIELAGDFSPVAFEPNARDSFQSVISLAGDFASVTQFENNLNGALGLGGDLAGETHLVLTEPVPITKSIAANAFANQNYPSGGGRLFINDVVTQFITAEINASAKSLGKSLKIELVRADLAQLLVGATFKFQIGKIVGGVTTWKTILDGGKLEGRSFSMSASRSTLNFSTTAGTEKLNKCPKNNLIVYDPAKAETRKNGSSCSFARARTNYSTHCSRKMGDGESHGPMAWAAEKTAEEETVRVQTGAYRHTKARVSPSGFAGSCAAGRPRPGASCRWASRNTRGRVPA